MDLLFNKLSKYTKPVTSTQTVHYAGCEQHCMKLTTGKRYLAVSFEFDHVCNLEITDEFSEYKITPSEDDINHGYHFENSSGYVRVIPWHEYSFFLELTNDFKSEHVDSIIKNYFSHDFWEHEFIEDYDNVPSVNSYADVDNKSFFMYRNEHRFMCLNLNHTCDFHRIYNPSIKFNNQSNSLDSGTYLIKCGTLA